MYSVRCKKINRDTSSVQKDISVDRDHQPLLGYNKHDRDADVPLCCLKIANSLCWIVVICVFSESVCESVICLKRSVLVKLHLLAVSGCSWFSIFQNICLSLVRKLKKQTKPNTLYFVPSSRGTKRKRKKSDRLYFNNHMTFVCRFVPTRSTHPFQSSFCLPGEVQHSFCFGFSVGLCHILNQVLKKCLALKPVGFIRGFFFAELWKGDESHSCATDVVSKIEKKMNERKAKKQHKWDLLVPDFGFLSGIFATSLTFYSSIVKIRTKYAGLTIKRKLTVGKMTKLWYVYRQASVLDRTAISLEFFFFKQW